MHLDTIPKSADHAAAVVITLESTGELLALKPIIRPTLRVIAGLRFDRVANDYLSADDPREPVTAEVPSARFPEIQEGVEVAISKLSPDTRDDPQSARTVEAIRRVSLLTTIGEDLAAFSSDGKAPA